MLENFENQPFYSICLINKRLSLLAKKKGSQEIWQRTFCLDAVQHIAGHIAEDIAPGCGVSHFNDVGINVTILLEELMKCKTLNVVYKLLC